MDNQIQIPPAEKAKTAAKESRLAYIDWMRGLACALMFQTHCYDSWLSPEARKSPVFIWSQLGGTLPAPLFIFLSGISFALVTERLREKGVSAGLLAKTTIRRGAEIFGLGVLFRVQEYTLGFGRAPWTDLFRVDVLNILGLSMMFMGVLCWLSAARGAQEFSPAVDLVAASRNRGIFAALFVAAIVAVATPYLWTTYRPRFLPWQIESYINGIHVYDKPQPWLFPIFPWAGFSFVGLAAGFFLFTRIAKRYEAPAFFALGGAGVLACLLSLKLDQSSTQLYPFYDYWHTSPSFFLMRCGILLMILFCVYAWCRWGLAQMGFSPIIQLGKTSLLVYWVHIEFVYGGLSILPKRQCTVMQATLGLLIIFFAMLILSLLRTNWKSRYGGAKKIVAAPAATQEV
ncbi:MAG: heparan-alpha-glucosaminide N-acetyltransferase domain-containing protein [Candidatus Acidiferrum sp.]|jgi:uncharacterized membrane protein